MAGKVKVKIFQSYVEKPEELEEAINKWLATEHVQIIDMVISSSLASYGRGMTTVLIRYQQL